MSARVAGAAGVPLDHARPRQVARLRARLLPGEQLLAAADAYGLGTGCFAITTLRVIGLEQGWIVAHTKLRSVPLGRITAVTSVDRGRDLLGARSDLRIDIGGDSMEFTLRGGRVAEAIAQELVRVLVASAPDSG
jgi:hypothetical protein